MNHIHYPTNIRTREDQSEVPNSMYTKKPHQITCHNKANIGNKPGLEFIKKTMHVYEFIISFIEPPYYWMKDSVTCRDWKMNYCCENLWGMPGLYELVAKAAEGQVPRPISKTDVLVDPPLKKHLFEDCEWQPFVRYCFLYLLYILRFGFFDPREV